MKEFSRIFPAKDIGAYPRTNWKQRTCYYTLANADVTKQIKQDGGSKGKADIVFTDEDREKIGQHAATNGTNIQICC